MEGDEDEKTRKEDWKKMSEKRKMRKETNKRRR